MIRILDKGSILRLIFPHLSTGSRGPKPKAEWVDIISCILYKFKSGCHWRLVSVQAFDSVNKISWSRYSIILENGLWMAAGRELVG